jgi:hypothetical protein
LLDAFSNVGVHATWATVGFLFFDNKDELLANLPEELPSYANAALSPYPSLEKIGARERDDPLHYARSLLLSIKATPHQEIGTHTFSHYYCLEAGQTQSQFNADIGAAKVAAGLIGVDLSSLVFPRNQFNSAYLAVCRSAGLRAYRGNQRSWLYQAGNGASQTRLKRALRLVDAYLPISGTNAHRVLPGERPTNVTASRFLRPVRSSKQAFEGMRLSRIKSEMTIACRKGLNYHLWWHPHNFGADPEANMAMLGDLLEHFRRLKDGWGMVSRNMCEVANAAREPELTRA